ncbi:unnamed protein product, partial [Phaeothamnion confervicola]
ERDTAIVELVDLLCRTTTEGRGKARVWAMEIAEPAYRGRAITIWAKARLAAGEADKPVLDAARAVDAGKQLLDLSESLSLRRKFADAELAALSADAAPAPERDEALSLIAEDMIAAEAGPQDILAVDGIVDAATRDRVLTLLVEYNLRRRSLDGARRRATDIGDAALAAR